MFEQLRIGDDAKEAKKFTPTHPNPAIAQTHGISLMLHGKHSEQYRNASAETLRKARKGALTAQQGVEQSARLIAACCTGWEGVTDPENDNKPRKFNRKDLAAMITDDDFRWLRLDAERFIMDDDNFF